MNNFTLDLNKVFTAPQNTKVDGYKLGHIDQYIKGTKFVHSNLTPRDDRLARVIREQFDGKMDYFGIQMLVIKLVSAWNESFFSQPKEKVMKAFRRRVKNYLGSPYGEGQIEAMGKLHDLGYLPLKIKTLPEGSRVNMKVPVFTVVNTHPDFQWLTNYCETYLSTNIWHTCNAASLSRQYASTSKRWGEVTEAPAEWYGIANHCFAGRGHRGDEDGMQSGMGHLCYSVGSDTLWAIDGIEYYYAGDSDKELIACSVNAFEHATATQRIAYFRNIEGFDGYPLAAEHASIIDICKFVYPEGIVSYVADSEDYFGVISSTEIKEYILSRVADTMGLCKFVFRPDSSPKTPFEVILGDDDPTVSELEQRGTLDILWSIYGGTTKVVNGKEYKVLNDKVGIIYGEAITLELQDKIYAAMEAHGWCVSNVLFGTGSWGYLQDSSRDSFGIAIKGTNSEVELLDDGLTQISMQKNPKTASSFKKSAKGLLRVEFEFGDFVLYDEQTKEQEKQGLLEVILLNNKLHNLTTWTHLKDKFMKSL
jgi:nicotinamide phosphoribosyltransferase